MYGRQKLVRILCILKDDTADNHRSSDTQAIRRHLRSIIHLNHLEVPEFDVLVGTARHKTLLVWSDLDGPDRTRMCLDLGNERRGRDVVERQQTRLGSDDDLCRDHREKVSTARRVNWKKKDVHVGLQATM